MSISNLAAGFAQTSMQLSNQPRVFCNLVRNHPHTHVAARPVSTKTPVEISTS